MGDNREFIVEEDLCTGCGDCIKAMPGHFADTGEDTAEVTCWKDVDVAKLELVMKACPGKAIQWK